MKRAIKFKGKRVDNKEWVYGSYTQMREDDHNECFRTEPHKTYHRIWQWEAGDWNMGGYANYEVIPETVGQFTGLKDKNGFEIYEGDIIRYETDYDLMRFEVKWNKDTLMWEAASQVIVDEPLYYKNGFIEVIGNIYDNSELIKPIGLPAASKSFTAEEVVNELEDCDTLDDAIMFFKEH